MKSFRRIAATKQDAAGTPNTSVSKQEKAGYLQTFSSKTFLTRDKWKPRYYVLNGSKLYRFYKKEDATSLPNASNARCRVINLGEYDICQYVPENDVKREHCFVLDSANSESDQTRYMFCANTKEEMQDWMSHLRKAISRIRETPKRPQRPPRTKVTSLPASAQESKKNDGDTASLVEAGTPGRLYNATKYRVRGPKGRRLPQKRSRQFRDANDKFISNSLCELDLSPSEEDLVRPSPLRRSGANSPPLRDRASSFGNLAYQYSSSDDSLFKERLRNAGKMDVARISEAEEDLAKPVNVRATVAVVDHSGSATPKSPTLQESHVIAVHLPDKETSTLLTSPDTPKQTGPSQPGVGPLVYLSDKLLQLNSSLTRFQQIAHEDLQRAKEFLADIKKKLLELPPGYTQVDKFSAQAITVMNSTEEDVETLLNVMARIEKSLQQVKEQCETIQNHA